MQLYVQSFLFHYLDKLRLHLHSGGKQVGQFYKQPLRSRSLHFLQVSFITVQRATYDAHFLAYHVRLHLLGGTALSFKLR